ncbi:hypothetical protein [Salinispora arenicola]|uniref:hypothetical protein n=1 Tax=Salinispora arenicola TaxID=168697 RepID=UPI00169B7002|nr:hypothetical protein [Salinispora arenicola]NIL64944.1 hypothetical protein [Salinispora arenicola]
MLVLAGDTAWDSGLDLAVAGTAAPVTDDALLHRLAELYRERWDGRWQLDCATAGSPRTSPAPARSCSR